MIKTCKICGKEFKANRARQAYCSPECMEEGRRAVGRAYYARKTAGKVTETTKTCPICGKTFEVDVFKTTQVYCSEECKEIGRKAKAKEYRDSHRAPKTAKTGICPVCGKEFERGAKQAGRKYCSKECYKLANRPSNRPKQQIQPFTLPKRVYRNKLHRLAGEALEHGLSYGQYVAMLERGARYEGVELD